MLKRSSKSKYIRILIITFFILTIVAPLFAMLKNLTLDNFVSIITSPQTIVAIRNSVLVGIVVTIISISVAMILALCISKTSIKYKNILSVIFTVPMLVPSISHGMGLIILLGSNGIITNALNLEFSIYGFWGIVIGSVLYSMPIAFLMLLDIFKYEDFSPYEAAKVLGFSKSNIFFKITLPYLRRPLLNVFFATFTLVVTDYGMALMVGGKFKTLPVLMFQEVIGLLDFDKGIVFGIILLIPALIAFLIDVLNKDNGNAEFATKQYVVKKNTMIDTLSYIICGVVSLIIALPIFSFVLLAFTKKYPVDMSITLDNILRTMDLSGGKYLMNSIFIGLAVAVIGTTLSYTCGYITARSNGKLAKMTHLFSIVSLAVPGIVLGLSYVFFFKDTFIYGTFAIIILVNIIHFFASPYLLAYNALSKVNQNLEAVGETLGISQAKMIKNVIIPQTKATLVEMFSYFFVNSMITISAVSFLSNSKIMPLSLLITQFEGQTLLECSAFVSLLLLFTNLFVKGITYVVQRRWQQE